MIFYGLLILLGIEQIFCFHTGSYIYACGIPVRTVHIPGLGALHSFPETGRKCRNLAVAGDRKRNTVHVRYRYSAGAGGPLLFLGQIRHDSPDSLTLRIPPAFFLFILHALISSLLSASLYSITTPFILGILMILFYRRLLNAVANVVREEGDSRS